MSLPRSSWIGPLYRHINANAKRDVLDFRFAGSQSGNRWNLPGQPTLYLASDIDVAWAEWARNLGSLTEHLRNSRALYRIAVRLSTLVDVRDDAVARHLHVHHDPNWYFDPTTSRALATEIRLQHAVQGMIVPSIAFPERHDRFNVVLFLERLPESTITWVTRVEHVATLDLRFPPEGYLSR